MVLFGIGVIVVPSSRSFRVRTMGRCSVLSASDVATNCPALIPPVRPMQAEVVIYCSAAFLFALAHLLGDFEMALVPPELQEQTGKLASDSDPSFLRANPLHQA